MSDLSIFISGGNFGSTQEYFQASFGATCSNQQPSFMSDLDKYHWPLFLYDASIFEIMRGSIFPISFMDSCGQILVVIQLTGGCLIPFILIPTGISSMNWNMLLLCGISTTGDIFNFSGILLLITFHLITVAKPYFIFSNLSYLRLETDFLFFLKRGGLS